MNKIMCGFFSTVFALILFTSPTLANEQSKEDWPSNLLFLSGPTGGQWFSLGIAIAENLDIRVIPTISSAGGGVMNLKNIEEGRGDIGFTLASFLSPAGSDEVKYQQFTTNNIQILANVYPQIVYFLVRKDFADKYNIKNVRDLIVLKKPVRFASLKTGSASEFIVSLLLKYGYNTNFEQLQKQGWQLSFSNYDETADNFVTRKLDCFAYTSGINVPFIKALEEHLDFVILPIEQDVLSILTEKLKTSTYIIQPNDYKSVKKPITTLGDYSTIIVRKDLPKSLVYEITKSLYNNKSYIGKNITDFNYISPTPGMPNPLSMHPGALEFWNNLGK